MLTYYFYAGYSYEAIIKFLSNYHDASMSIKTLKRRFSEYGLKKKDRTLSNDVISQLIQREIQGPHIMRGYRGIWHLLKTSYNISFTTDSVMKFLKEIDPVGSEMRRARILRRRKYISSGPNTVWHVDGYDKLKPYGFPIHGAIDGFSRRVLWLNVTRSNNNSDVHAYFYINTVKSLKLCPEMLRTDCGTENVLTACVQCFLANSVNAHKYGSSHSNQQIDNNWSHSKKLSFSWIVDFFKDVVFNGELEIGNTVHMEALWFVFYEFIRSELDKVRVYLFSTYAKFSEKLFPT